MSLPNLMSKALDNVVFIFLDDVRDPPSDQWVVVRTAEKAYEALLHYHAEGKEIVLSLDHDLGEDIPTGYDLLNWLEKDVVTDDTFRPDIAFMIHSANPVGRENMARAINELRKYL